MFADEARAELVGATLGTPLWFPPVLTVSFARRGFLVAVLESPGPFCCLSHRSPCAGIHAPPRFQKLAGAEIVDIAMHGDDRVLHIDALTRGDRARVTFSIVLFGSAGGAVLRRGDAVLESIGRRADTGAGSAGRAGSPAAVPAPFYLVAERRLGDAAPTTTPDSGADARRLGPFDSVLDACEALGRTVVDGAHETILRRVMRPARRKVEALGKLAANLEADIDTAATHADVRREAETLAAYQTRVPPGASHVELPDLYDAEQVVRIELDPAEPLHIQIEKRFRRAAKLEKSLAHSGRRLELVRREATELSASLRLLERATSFTEALHLVEAIRAKFSIELDDRATPVGTRKPPRTAEKTYREIDLDAHWFVVVGRSNFENDEITFRVAAPTDLWFHAHQVPGSHVILRPRGGGGGTGPPARIVELAASVAAHFSKARHSGLVAVIYTQRKYVRKFRGAQPGQVICEREKMLMVPPRLPDAGPGD